MQIVIPFVDLIKNNDVIAGAHVLYLYCRDVTQRDVLLVLLLGVSVVQGVD